MSERPPSTQMPAYAPRCVCTGLLICASFASGCQRHDQARSHDTRNAATNAASQPSDDSDKSLTFADREWTLVGPCQATGDIFRPSMSAVYYTTNDANIRLIKLVPDESSPLKEGVFSRILRVQINQNGRWISHGSSADWDLDGGRGEMYYIYGKLHGTQREWYSNGQLHIEREYVSGKLHGRDRGWWPNGKPQYDALNVNGEEISGKAWNEDGRPI